MLPSQEGIRTLARADQNVTNNLFREKLTHPRNELVLSQMSKPWTIIRRIVGLVIVTYLLSNSILMVFFGMYLGDLDGFLLSFIGLFCSLPLLFLSLIHI